ncbi:MAG: hypothetical protein QOE31_464, partial [Solirubrobacteraceae bacterium]|nr:hypothetical protein [Solirubrobacteraceae bacterium]
LTDDDRTRTDVLLAIARACRLRYDTDAFRAALERALSLDPPAAVSAEILSQLAHAGSAPELWRTPPGRAAVEAWAARSLALAEPRSRAAALALMARARTSPGSGRASADAAVDVAERIGDPALIASAFLVQAEEATARGVLEEAREWTERALAATSDPFERDGLLLGAVFAFARLGRIPAARACAAEHDAITAHISPHQEVHAIAARLVVETTAASWGAARALAGRAGAAAVANRDTPCQFNWRSLLMAALAHGQLGEQREARRLQQRALSVVEVGGPASREPALIRLELLRGDLDAVERLLAEDPGAGKYDVDYRAARLDALAALGDAERVEREAAAVIDIGGYAAPFGLRALGVVRGERDLLDQAAAAFDALGLDARADETRSGRGGD